MKVQSLHHKDKNSDVIKSFTNPDVAVVSPAIGSPKILVKPDQTSVAKHKDAKN